MSAVTGHIMRRSVELASAQLRTQDKEEKQPSGVQVALLVLTVLAFTIAMVAVSHLKQNKNGRLFKTPHR